MKLYNIQISERLPNTVVYNTTALADYVPLKTLVAPYKSKDFSLSTEEKLHHYLTLIGSAKCQFTLLCKEKDHV